MTCRSCGATIPAQARRCPACTTWIVRPAWQMMGFVMGGTVLLAHFLLIVALLAVWFVSVFGGNASDDFDSITGCIAAPADDPDC